MKRPLYLTLIIVLALASMMIIPGCTPEIPKPDLIAVNNPSDWASFCDFDNENLIVYIKNQGTADAGPSTVEVDFGIHGKVSQPVPSLTVGTTTTILIPMSHVCYDPDCEFVITVDSSNDIDESNELNNIQISSCLI